MRTCWRASNSSTHLPEPMATECSGLSVMWTGMPVHVAEGPLDSVALGAGKCVEEFEALQQVLVSEPRR